MIPYLHNYYEFLIELKFLLNKYELGFRLKDDNLIFYKLKNDWEVLEYVSYDEETHEINADCRMNQEEIYGLSTDIEEDY